MLARILSFVGSAGAQREREPTKYRPGVASAEMGLTIHLKILMTTADTDVPSLTVSWAFRRTTGGWVITTLLHVSVVVDR